MHAISRRYRKPKARPSKKNRAAISKLQNYKRLSAVVKNDDSSNNLDTSPSYEIKTAVSDVDNTTKCSSENNVVMNLPVTASDKKLSACLPSTSNCSGENLNDDSYVLMNNKLWAPLLSNIKCDECLNSSLDVTTKGIFGYSTKIELICKNCEKVYKTMFTSARAKQSDCFDVNKRLVESFLKIGKGHAALEVFSMVMGVHAMDKKTFSKCLNSLSKEKEKFRDEILLFARNIVRSKHEELDSSLQNNNIIDITVSYDGTWQKRGHTSLYGIGIVIDVLTGLVIDYEVLSKYCPECVASKRDMGENSAEFDVWFQGHKSECSKNFTGSSNAMEMAAAEILWKRSVSTCGMRYVSILSDGDAKTYQYLLGMNVYGREIKINKEECLNHVAKRLGTGLRNKVKEWRSKGVTIGGRKEGSLKEDTIIKLTNFYRKAIKENVPDLDMMKSSIYASLLHCSSTDASPKHSKCPAGVTSWCFYQKAIASNEQPKSHTSMKTKISEDVLAKILPVYQRLASTELLSRCISGKTQNANESIHSVIWKKCHKDTFVSKKRLELSVISAVSEFNFGCLNTLSIEQEEINSLSLLIAQKRDKRRLEQSRVRNSSAWKKSRNDKKFNKMVKNNANVKKEGKTYGAGEF